MSRERSSSAKIAYTLPMLFAVLLSFSLGIDITSPAFLPLEGIQERVQEDTEKEKPKEKRVLPRLSGTKKKKVSLAITRIGKAKKDETAQESCVELAQYGLAAVPEILNGLHRAEKSGRIYMLLAVVDELLPQEDLHLIAPTFRKKTPIQARVYLLRRWADSTREDAEDALRLGLKEKDEVLLWEAARVLAKLVFKESIPILHAQIQTRWTKEAEFIIEELKDLPRRKLGDALLPYLSSGDYKSLLAGLHLYALAGKKAHSGLLSPFLSDHRSQVRLAAINACRMTIGGLPPLTRPSMTQLVEEAEAWKKKI